MLTQKQFAAMRKYEEIGEQIIQSGQGNIIAKEYVCAKGITSKLARKYVPNPEVSSWLAEQVIHYVIRKILAKSVRERISLENRVWGGKARLENMKSKKISFFDSHFQKKYQKKAIMARGMVPWSNSEIRSFISLLKNEENWVLGERGRLMPDYDEMCEYLNDKYHKGKAIRNENALDCLYTRIFRGKVNR